MVFSRVKSLRKKWNKSKVGSTLNRVTGNRYGRGYKQIMTKGIPQMVKDITSLKSMINAEKKNIDIYTSNNLETVAQLNGNSSGFWTKDITPVVTQGTTYSTRNGASIKLSSSYMKFQFYHQTSTSIPIKLKMYIVQTKTFQTNLTTFVQNMFLYNRFLSTTSIYDSNSMVNPDYFGLYKILRTKSITVPGDQISGVNMMKNVNIPHKWNRTKGHHIRYAGDTNTVLNGQVFVLIFADCGNLSGTASTITPVPVQAATTGINFNYDIKHYYYDN